MECACEKYGWSKIDHRQQRRSLMEKNLRKLQDLPWLPIALTFLGGAIYIFQAWAYAHIQTSFVDEGGYLYIGSLYARGILQPFQSYTIPAWYAPLSYLIPGQIEKWAGAGLLTGRFLSIFFSVVMLVALWWTARRFGGNWGGALVVCAIALTPISIQIYSLAISQALAACLLAGSLFFILGEKRSLWQIALGSLLAGLMVMTRHNLVLTLPLLVLYVFWQHGRKAGWWALVACLAPILVLHVVYWPNILQLWTIWLPSRLTPFLDAFRFPAAGLLPGDTTGISPSLLAFVQGFRFQYIPLLGFIACLFLWPRQGEWKSKGQQRAAVFMAVLFVVQTLLHLWATLVSSDQAQTCRFCFTPYLTFFDITALLLVVITFPSWKKKVSKAVQAGIILFAILLSLGLGYAVFDRFGPWLLSVKFPAFTRGLDPRQWVPFITLWDILANKFHLDYWTSRLYVPILAGLILGIILLVLAKVGFKAWQKKSTCRQLFLWNLFPGCHAGFGSLAFASHGRVLPPGWTLPCRYPRLLMPKLAKPWQNIFPPAARSIGKPGQPSPYCIPAGFPFICRRCMHLLVIRINGDPLQLEKYGLWNDELARRWRTAGRFYRYGGKQGPGISSGRGFRRGAIPGFSNHPGKPL